MKARTQEQILALCPGDPDVPDAAVIESAEGNPMNDVGPECDLRTDIERLRESLGELAERAKQNGDELLELAREQPRGSKPWLAAALYDANARADAAEGCLDEIRGYAQRFHFTSVVDLIDHLRSESKA